MITWLMVGLLLFTESACERGKDALSNGAKNGKAEAEVGPGDKAGTDLKASQDEEDVYRLTCYTCVNVSNNKMCNEWAIDTPCPASGGDFCRSLHVLDSRGQSVLVSKSCVSKKDCSSSSVGCVPIDTQKICISCCDTSYCNIESPTNATNATFSRKRPPPRSPANASSDGRADVPAAAAPTAAAWACTAFPAISVFLNRAYH